MRSNERHLRPPKSLSVLTVFATNKRSTMLVIKRSTRSERKSYALSVEGLYVEFVLCFPTRSSHPAKEEITCD